MTDRTGPSRRMALATLIAPVLSTSLAPMQARAAAPEGPTLVAYLT